MKISHSDSLRTNDHGLRSLMVMGVSGTFALKITYTALAFLTGIVLARLLGAKGYGTYAYAISWITLLGVPAGLGLHQVVVRNVAEYREQKVWDRIHGLLRFAFVAVLLASIACLILASGVVWIALDESASEMRYCLWLAFILLPIQAVATQYGAALAGFQRIVTSQLPGMLIHPMFFLLLIAVAYVFVQSHISVPYMLVLYLAAAGIALISAVVLAKRTVPEAVRANLPTYESRAWMRSALPLMLMGGMYIINSNADILMLGTMKGSEMAGVYKAATRGAELIAFSLAIINPSLAPIITRLHTSGERQRLQHGITRTARMGLLFAFPVAVTLLCFGNWFLMIFGPEFGEGRSALSILSTGQLFNVAAGSVGVILIMTGHETKAAIGVGVSAVANVLLNLMLIPKWGIEGAATATTVSLVLWNIILIRYVWKCLGVDPTALALWSQRGE
ncbi:MAG: flippase [Deltaproteobacteria bacterium]|nr:flippase [Deltaproteobacteria bacterium]